MFSVKRVSIILLLLVTGVVLLLHMGISDQSYYVASENCQECHQTHYQSWNENTLHPKQFHPVRGPEDLLGDFTSDDPALTFKQEEVEFVIGNKWEQVYVRMIDGEYYPLPAKWLIPLQKWIPYKVDSWRQTPMSTQCNGCHTTGFNPETHEFNEFGIGCEACHGPGSSHVQKRQMSNAPWCSVCHAEPPLTKEEIIVSAKSATCGQCHNRGSQVVDKDHMKTSFSFPVNYKPGNELSDSFKPLTATDDKKKKHWWKSGLSKNRHQEYADFSRSGHAKSLRNLLEKRDPHRGEPEDSCLRCHSTDYRQAAPDERPNLESAKLGITCVACHEPHGLDRKLGTGLPGPHRCGECHIDSLTASTADEGKPHYPCPATKVQCADCHMPRIVKSGGVFSIRSHAFRIVPPTATREDPGMPNSCQNGGCHKDRSLDWAVQAFREYYP